MEATKTNLVKVGDLAMKVVDEAKKRSTRGSGGFRIEDCEEFNVVAYIDGKSTNIGFGWMNLASQRPPRIKIRPEFAAILAGETEPKEAWIFPRDRRGKKKGGV
jgi:hypothetical protein